MASKLEMGDALLIASGTDYDPKRRHLHVVTHLSVQRECLLVPISSWANDLCDSTCLIEPQRHPFIVRKSYALYRKARIVGEAALIGWIEDGLCERREPLERRLAERIRDGVLNSDQVNRRIRAFLCDLLDAS